MQPDEGRGNAAHMESGVSYDFCEQNVLLNHSPKLSEPIAVNISSGSSEMTLCSGLHTTHAKGKS